MRFLIETLIKHHVFIIFIFLACFCLSLIIKINPYREEFHKKLFFSQEGQELPAMTFRIDYNQSVHVKPTEELIIKDEIIRKEGA